ncbi:MASE1 domain protein [Leptospira broomii serovar Hurstbridge str. 5399]|uniref:histidine kinase n=1 Tax=Leptospira broomii serovar Hurstbridge str. 5399 TaxID=1049789 RepID=T0FBB7_9LEPT|nr:MASE1 domain-containing protein [Leptospira broomii]EQA44882.1 MASE1 domain protein [Leptospira broomii serovar Hurstbridge str. 5399]
MISLQPFTSHKESKIFSSVARILFTAFIYFLLAHIGFYTAAYSGYASPVWPASGWALAALILFGRKAAFGVMLGSFFYNISIKSGIILSTPFAPEFWGAIIIGFGSGTQAFLGSILYHKFIPNIDLTQKTSFVIRFLWFETLVCTVSASVANTGLYLLGIVPATAIPSTWIFWWLGDSLGVFLYFPFFLAWLKPERSYLKKSTLKETFPVILLLLLFAAVIFNVFRIHTLEVDFPISYLLIAMVVWSSLQFGIRESSLSLTLISGLAIFGAFHGSSQFLASSRETSLLLLQSFLSALSITSLLVLSVVRERREAERQLILSHGELEKLINDRTQELRKSNVSLGKTEARYKGLFENVPIAIFECDYSQVKALLDSLPVMGKLEFYRFLSRNLSFVRECSRSVRVIDANRESVKMFRAKSKQEAFSASRSIYNVEESKEFIKLLYCIRQGSRIFEYDTFLISCDGTKFEATLRWSLPPEFEKTFSSVIVTAEEITGKKEAERQLKASLREKDVMLKEIHHRVKNNLQAISSLFSLQAEYVNDPKIHEAFAESQHRIQTMALIHDELYQSKDLGDIEFSGYAERLSGKIRAAYKVEPEVSLKMEMERLNLEVSIAIPLGLVLNELLTNCFKYAFPSGLRPESGERMVTVRIRKEKETGILEVSDNGLGLPSDLDPFESPSFGLTLVQVLTRQLKGKLDFSSSAGKGTSFRIRFAIP